MAQRTVIKLTDDIDGGPATETVLFGLDGDALEIDLNAGNADALRDALAPYVGAGRRASGSRARPASAPKEGTTRRDVDERAAKSGRRPTTSR